MYEISRTCAGTLSLFHPPTLAICFCNSVEPWGSAEDGRGLSSEAAALDMKVGIFVNGKWWAWHWDGTTKRRVVGEAHENKIKNTGWQKVVKIPLLQHASWMHMISWIMWNNLLCNLLKQLLLHIHFSKKVKTHGTWKYQANKQNLRTWGILFIMPMQQQWATL